MERTFRHGDTVVHVSGRHEANQVDIRVGEDSSTFEWEELGPGDYLLRAGAVQNRCLVARDGDDRWVWVDGVVHHLKIESATARRAGGATDAGPLSPMPGQILSVLVKPGDTVRHNQPLVIMEAMKMQYEIVAPCDGTVVRVHVSEKQQVAGGVTLVELDSLDGTGGGPKT